MSKQKVGPSLDHRFPRNVSLVQIRPQSYIYIHIDIMTHYKQNEHVHKSLHIFKGRRIYATRPETGANSSCNPKLPTFENESFKAADKIPNRETHPSQSQATEVPEMNVVRPPRNSRNRDTYLSQSQTATIFER